MLDNKVHLHNLCYCQLLNHFLLNRPTLGVRTCSWKG